ncbi:MAG: hypothetical protein OXI81_05585 [Paracoccaceae bacterium]|nr:hypothetical protein [Paracoccaceae bacterium]
MNNSAMQGALAKSNSCRFREAFVDVKELQWRALLALSPLAETPVALFRIL